MKQKKKERKKEKRLEKQNKGRRGEEKIKQV